MQWKKSSYSVNNGACFEVAAAPEGTHFDGKPIAVLVRNGRDPKGPALAYTREEWEAFLGGVKKGEFDYLVEA